jgi:catechol 2,3-dioxygenase-like lactoylglutathione lyase family enzyme
MKPSRVLETCLYVDDLEAAEAFYRDVIGLELYAKVPGRHVFFRCGDGMVLLFNPEVTRQSTPPLFSPHGAVGDGHVAFHMAPDEIAGWREHLDGHGVEIEQEFTWPGGGVSIYFRDPDGNSLEVATPQVWEMEK